MGRNLVIALLAIVLAACSAKTVKEYAEEYKKLQVQYIEAQSSSDREAIYQKQADLLAEAAKRLSEEDFKQLQNLINENNAKSSYRNTAEDESIEAYVQEHNRLLELYRAAGSSAAKDSLYREMVQLEERMHDLHTKKAYEEFLTRRQQP